MPSRASLPLRAVGLLLAFALSACGGDSERPAKSAADEERSERRTESRRMETSSEIGGLDEEKVDKVFKDALGGLERCLGRGAERVEFLGGSVSFFLKIGSGGRVEHAHLEKSSLGDRETEKCMLSVLRKKTWPEPVGGEHGLARKSFDFDPPNDVRPPTEWDASNVETALEKLQDPVAECKGSVSGSFEATVYVNTDGSVLASSVTPPDESGEEAVDCLVDALRGAQFDSPGSWPAKVTFSL